MTSLRNFQATALRLALSVVLLTTSASLSAQPAASAAGELLVYVGTYTGAKSKGIYALRLDLASGSLTPLGVVAEIPSPSFLAIHPTKPLLYAANEVSDFSGKPSGGVSAFTIDRPTGKLTALNQQPSGGRGPCHLVVDKTGQAVLVANYGGGSIESIPLREDGSLAEPASFIQHKGSSVNPQRQKEPHAHSINVDPSNQFAVAADLGLDRLMIYKFDPAKATLSPNDPAFAAVKPGAGPRHFSFHPDGRYAYVINEMHCTVTAFSFDAKKGELREIQTISTLPEGQAVLPSFSTAEVQVHPSGKFLYGSNRGHHSIAAFQIDPSSGRLTRVENESTQGKTPRNFGLDPTGAFLLAANQDSDNIVAFKIDQATGALNPTGHQATVPTPVCVKFVK